MEIFGKIGGTRFSTSKKAKTRIFATFSVQIGNV